jgi:hypothetical protein
VKFPLGDVYMTPGVHLGIPPSEVLQALRRHAHGDWGDLDADDRRANEISLADGTRLLSAYTSKDGKKFWIVTEADRSSTTVLLPEEY